LQIDTQILIGSTNPSIWSFKMIISRVRAVSIFGFKIFPIFILHLPLKTIRVFYLRNRKHVPCFHRVIETPVEVWENEKCCENTSRRRVFLQLFRLLPNFHGCFYNSIEKRWTCSLFLLENTATNNGKQLVYLDHQNVNSFCTRAIITSTARASSVFLWSYYGGPQLSHQIQIAHIKNKLFTSKTNCSHQNQIAHIKNKLLTSNSNSSHQKQIPHNKFKFLTTKENWSQKNKIQQIKNNLQIKW